MGCLMQIIGFALIIVGFTTLDNGGGWWMLIGLLTLAASSIPIVLNQKNQTQEDERHKRDFNEENKIPNSAQTIIKYVGEVEQSFNIWKDNCCLKLASSYNEGKWEKYNLNINDIISYNIIGDAYTETNVTGGGSSLAGAVVGGVIAGGAGAVIGSRKKIGTETKRIDKRKTVLTYTDNGTIINMFFSPETYEILLQLIPEKDTNIVKMQRTNQVDSVQVIENEIVKSHEIDVYDKIKKLAKLRDENLITEEEFNVKKKVLLDKIK